EDRAVPASFAAANVAQLVADVNQANLLGGMNTISLAAHTVFKLTAVNNTTAHGDNGLPVVAAGDNLTIVGNGSVLERSTRTTPAFRLIEVDEGAVLTMKNLTLQGGLATSEAAQAGGAVYNQGALTLDGVTVQDNGAEGGLSLFDGTGLLPPLAAGGGIW